jgi:hypothetical protein
LQPENDAVLIQYTSPHSAQGKRVCFVGIIHTTLQCVKIAKKHDHANPGVTPFQTELNSVALEYYYYYYYFNNKLV